ncbi:cupin domain-containing protein [Pseudovibrio sp. Tun.PSC04-5.I4]|uniref:cupin domain-containing protein n=1 Tax=Pseudovibrio sp. Tun.PSC04-5.I4 TaxID=1798213 RepID=UPI000882C814|nr:cupin domain-containing protein [Pseudovibrio sp. Tun.PSC04-5.I4]SDQ21275.1 Mannose-6-phosphate isomerase, cupin superfamily [Pseudovibrio sp. Tun.PSC04-5.I4]
MAQLETKVDHIASAEVRLPTNDLKEDLPFFSKVLGMKLDMIFPADNPAIAVMSGHGLRVRLEKGAPEKPGTLRLLCKEPASFAGGQTELTAPNGTRIEIVDASPVLEMPKTQHSFIVRHMIDNDPWVIGRAGMQYRDLIPDRLGGSIIASHIRIPDAGPVPDMVHYHTVGFQLIFCYHGWVRLVYEDQGEPFILKAGDCVIQPPEIRHRVLESSGELEVIEIGVPAEHVTSIDHEMDLPNTSVNPEREFQGQKFVRHQLDSATWQPFRLEGFECRDTGIGTATKQVANVQVARVTTGPTGAVTSHTSDILFSFVMEGSVTLVNEEGKAHELKAGDAFVIPPEMKTSLLNGSEDLEILEVSLPGSFETNVHEVAP